MSNTRSNRKKLHIVTGYQNVIPGYNIGIDDLSQLTTLILNPAKTHVADAFDINRANPSATNINRDGDKGSPCLRPFSVVKSFVRHPLTNTDIEMLQTQALIQFYHFKPNSHFLRIYIKKSLIDIVVSLFEINIQH